ncbi:MAG: hypothetical protein WC728_09270 [Elusimicrobiota bacterium]
MQRLPSEEPAFRWFAPALAFSFAAFALSFVPVRRDPFLQDAQEAELAEWVSLQEPGLPITEEE